MKTIISVVVFTLCIVAFVVVAGNQIACQMGNLQ